jgi:hypothetical protein
MTGEMTEREEFGGNAVAYHESMRRRDRIDAKGATCGDCHNFTGCPSKCGRGYCGYNYEFVHDDEPVVDEETRGVCNGWTSRL